MNGKKLAHGAIASIVANSIKSVLLFLSLPLMAKLVGPEQYGLYSVAMPAYLFAMAIADAGLGLSLARETDDESAVWSTAVFGLAGVSIALALFLAAYAWVVAQAMGDTRIIGVTAVLSISLLFTALAIVPVARLMRDGEFSAIATIDFLAFLCGLAAALLMALKGFGVWALVGQGLLTSFSRCLLMNLKMPTNLKWVFSYPLLRPHIILGGAIGIGRLADFSGRMVEMLVIGRAGGAPLSGAFGFGNQVTKFAVEVFNNTMWNVTYMLALKSGGDPLKFNYFQMTRLCGAILIPIGGFAAVGAQDVVEFAMGPEWSDAAFLISIFAPACAIGAVASIGIAVLVARGIARDTMLFAVELAVLRVLAVCALPMLGWRAMVYALAAAYIINAMRGYWLVYRNFKWDIRPILLWQIKPILATVAAAGCFKFVLSLQGVSVSGLLLSGLAGGAVYVMTLYMLDRQQLTKDVTAFITLLRSKPAATA